MALTPDQLVTLRADMDGASSAAIAAMRALNDTQGIKDYYNGPHPTLKVWREDAPIEAIRGAILWDRFTPKDAVPTSDALAVAIWQARSDACQGKQFNLQNMLQSSTGTVPAHLRGFRNGISDLLAALPSNTNGATQNGGWLTAGTPVQLAMQRPITILENLFASTVDGARISTMYGYQTTALEISQALA